MKKITHYEPPSADDLSALKAELGLKGWQMASLAGVADSNQWRKYTGGAAPRRASVHMLFFLAARLELGDEQLEMVYRRMRAFGAELDIEEQAHVAVHP